MRYFYGMVALSFLVSTVPLQAQPVPSTRSETATLADRLLGYLQGAHSQIEARYIERRLRQLWMQSESPAAKLLRDRGQRDLDNLAVADALTDFDAALALSPLAAELHVSRATARSMAGGYSGALQDIAIVLAQEPRCFDAWAALSRITEAHGDVAGALSAWQKMLVIDPYTVDGEQRLIMLRHKAEGLPT